MKRGTFSLSRVQSRPVELCRGEEKVERISTITIEPDRVAVTLSADGTVWMTIEEIALIFHATGASVERHIAKLFSECELDKRKVRTEQNIVRNGRRYTAEYYNFDMIIALCFRIDTPSSKAFRRWIGNRVLRSLKREAAAPLILRIESQNETTS